MRGNTARSLSEHTGVLGTRATWLLDQISVLHQLEVVPPEPPPPSLLDERQPAAPRALVTGVLGFNARASRIALEPLLELGCQGRDLGGEEHASADEAD